MLELTLNAHETALITMALELAKDRALPTLDSQMENLRQEIIEMWIAQNPDHADLPWLQL